MTDTRGQVRYRSPHWPPGLTLPPADRDLETDPTPASRGPASRHGPPWAAGGSPGAVHAYTASLWSPPPRFRTARTGATPWRLGVLGDGEARLVIGLDGADLHRELVRRRSALLAALTRATPRPPGARRPPSPVTIRDAAARNSPNRRDMQSETTRSRPRRWGPALKGAVGVALVGTAVYLAKFTPLPVVGHTVVTGPVITEVLGTGTLEARVQTTLSSRIQERLAEVLVDQNDTVKAGQLLARLDDGELRQQVAMAEAAHAAAQARAERIRVDEARAEAVARQARRDHERVAELLATRVSSPADLDKAAEQLDVAEADLRRAHAASREAESEVVTAAKTLAYQQERLGFTRIVSPYDGLVVRRDRDPGGVVVPGSSLLQLISTNELWIAAWVDETALAGLATGQVARVVFRSEPGREYAGRVARLGREADRETREFVVEVRVEEPPANWAVGQRAEVFIETGRKAGVPTLPAAFLMWRDGGAGAFVLEGGRAVWRPLTLGGRGRGLVEIASGAAAGEQLLRPLEARQSLQPGRRVQVIPPGGVSRGNGTVTAGPATGKPGSL